MFSADMPDPVALATKNDKRVRIALECIESDCNIIIEKLISFSIADAKAIFDAGSSHSVSRVVPT